LYGVPPPAKQPPARRPPPTARIASRADLTHCGELLARSSTLHTSLTSSEEWRRRWTLPGSVCGLTGVSGKTWV